MATYNTVLQKILDDMYTISSTPSETNATILEYMSKAYERLRSSAAPLEFIGMSLDYDLTETGKFCGITEAGTAAEALSFGHLCYFNSSSKWAKFDADAEATASGKLGICVLAAAGDTSATTILLWGKVRADAVFPTFTVGGIVYGSTTAGEVVTSAPGTGKVVRIVGYGNTADELYFCPSPDYFTLA